MLYLEKFLSILMDPLSVVWAVDNGLAPRSVAEHAATVGCALWRRQRRERLNFWRSMTRPIKGKFDSGALSVMAPIGLWQGCMLRPTPALPPIP